MNLKLIACKVLFREISLIAADLSHIIDVTYISREFHNTPEKLRELLQAEIDAVESGNDIRTMNTQTHPLDAILLGYGLCSNSIVGLKSRKYPLVVPRAHDCVTLLLGSKERYREYFNAHKGVYWYTKGWIDNSPMPSKERYKTAYASYVERFGEDNADYLMEMEQGWMKEYNWAAFVDWPRFDNTAAQQYTKDCADFLGWSYDCLTGSDSLLRDFLCGEWDHERFLVIQPGQEIQPSYDESIVRLQPSAGTQE